MKKFYKESLIVFSVILFFDLLRLFYVITNGLTNVFDFMWIILLIMIIVFKYLSKDDKKYINIICLVLGYLPILFVILNLIQISSTGLTFNLNFFFMLFEAILIAGINILFTIEFKKIINEYDKTIKVDE